MSIDTQQFVWPTSFACTVVTDALIIPNFYTLNVSIEPISSQTNISLGFKKIRYFVDNYLQNSIFISNDNPLIDTLKSTESNLVIFPVNPYDYCVGSVLYQKLLTITEKYFHIDQLAIDSAVGDHIQYYIRDPEDCGLDLEGEHWWNTDSVSTGIETETKWDDLDINELPKFEPRIIKGGKSET